MRTTRSAVGDGPPSAHAPAPHWLEIDSPPSPLPHGSASAQVLLVAGRGRRGGAIEPQPAMYGKASASASTQRSRRSGWCRGLDSRRGPINGKLRVEAIRNVGDLARREAGNSAAAMGRTHGRELAGRFALSRMVSRPSFSARLRRRERPVLVYAGVVGGTAVGTPTGHIKPSDLVAADRAGCVVERSPVTQ